MSLGARMHLFFIYLSTLQLSLKVLEIQNLTFLVSFYFFFLQEGKLPILCIQCQLKGKRKHLSCLNIKNPS